MNIGMKQKRLPMSRTSDEILYSKCESEKLSLYYWMEYIPMEFHEEFQNDLGALILRIYDHCKLHLGEKK
jgi:hypothetical protein